MILSNKASLYVLDPRITMASSCAKLRFSAYFDEGMSWFTRTCCLNALQVQSNSSGNRCDSYLAGSPVFAFLVEADCLSDLFTTDSTQLTNSSV
jgi:hypothetical protein